MFPGVNEMSARVLTPVRRDLRVLLAVGDEELRDRLASHLAGHGWETWEAATGREMMEWLSVGQRLKLAGPDALVLDAAMTCTPGVSLLAELRRAGCDAPVVWLTEGVDAEVSEGIRWGAAAMLEKPFSTDAFEIALLNVAWLDGRLRLRPWPWAH